MENIKMEKIEVRRCEVCKNVMFEGYCIDNGFQYYCSLKCMEKNGLSHAEFLELYDGGDSYWTEWFDEYSEEEITKVKIVELLKVEHNRLEDFIKNYTGELSLNYEINRLRDLKQMIKKVVDK